MGEKIGTEKIEMEKGYLYYVGKDGFVTASPMKNSKIKGLKKKKVSNEKIRKDEGYMYYVKNGYVYRTKRKNA